MVGGPRPAPRPVDADADRGAVRRPLRGRVGQGLQREGQPARRRDHRGGRRVARSAVARGRPAVGTAGGDGAVARVVEDHREDDEGDAEAVRGVARDGERRVLLAAEADRGEVGDEAGRRGGVVPPGGVSSGGTATVHPRSQARVEVQFREQAHGEGLLSGLSFQCCG